MSYKELAAAVDPDNFVNASDSLRGRKEAAAILRRLDAAQGGVDGVMQLATDLDDYGAETPNKAKIRNALRTAVEALALGGWQPIETAPRDGTAVWAYNGTQGAMMWAEFGQWEGWVWVDDLFSDADPAPYQPTYYMPLPPAPKEPT